ncbi:hypothetical protein O181_010231 [Austropuccinia psidii MF-1]|uniref:Uncharacterized protein n=1 Tax=Austropuccinia psidii MF-1 TaxID=1389203 RepID=A0A9Q3GK76_9BASI|nr:hypothetical protein [Austropuccinia psidii MF-1]
MLQPMPKTKGNSTELNKLPASSPESGSKISYMVISNQLGIEVESLSHENNQDPPVLPEFEHKFIFNICNLSKPNSFLIAFISDQPPSSPKQNLNIYGKEKTFEPCEQTEDAGQDDVFFSGKLGIMSKEDFSQTSLKQYTGWKKIKMIVKFLIMYLKILVNQ